MTNKHTPAPWEWIEDRFNGGFSGICGGDNQEVLFPNCRNDGDEGMAWFEEFPSEADKNLIAAAPELLEALEKYHSLMFDLWGVPDSVARKLCGAFIKADAAIKKAKGE